jgi:hypothetical protein
VVLHGLVQLVLRPSSGQWLQLLKRLKLLMPPLPSLHSLLVLAVMQRCGWRCAQSLSLKLATWGRLVLVQVQMVLLVLLVPVLLPVLLLLVLVGNLVPSPGQPVLQVQ